MTIMKSGVPRSAPACNIRDAPQLLPLCPFFSLFSLFLFLLFPWFLSSLWSLSSTGSLWPFPSLSYIPPYLNPTLIYAMRLFP